MSAATSDGPPRDGLGHELTATEAELLDTYRRLEALLERDLAPAVAANVKEALASLWQAANDLALLDDRCEV